MQAIAASVARAGARLINACATATSRQKDNTATTALRLASLKVKLFTDGADKAQIVEMAKQPWIAGFTTNPSLLKKAGVSDYAGYARDLVAAVPDRHISFEVFSDDIPEMVAQARVIASWGKNVYVKLPVTTTRGEPRSTWSSRCHATAPRST